MFIILHCTKHFQILVQVGEVKDTATGPVLECISREEQVWLSLLFFVFVAFFSHLMFCCCCVLCFFVAFTQSSWIDVPYILYYFRCATPPTSPSSLQSKKSNAFNNTGSSVILSQVAPTTTYVYLYVFLIMNIFSATDVVQSNSTSKVCLRPLQRICG